MTCSRSTLIGRSSHGLPEFAPGRETQSRLARDRETRDADRQETQSWLASWPPSSGTHSHGSPKASPARKT